MEREELNSLRRRLQGDKLESGINKKKPQGEGRLKNKVVSSLFLCIRRSHFVSVYDILGFNLWRKSGCFHIQLLRCHFHWVHVVLALLDFLKKILPFFIFSEKYTGQLCHTDHLRVMEVLYSIILTLSYSLWVFFNPWNTKFFCCLFCLFISFSLLNLSSSPKSSHFLVWSFSFFLTQKYFYLCVCMLSSFSRVWLCAILCIAPCQTLPFRQEYWSGLPCPSPGHLPNPGVEHRPPELQADSLPPEPLGKPYLFLFNLQMGLK